MKTIFVIKKSAKGNVFLAVDDKDDAFQIAMALTGKKCEAEQCVIEIKMLETKKSMSSMSVDSVKEALRCL